MGKHLAHHPSYKNYLSVDLMQALRMEKKNNLKRNAKYKKQKLRKQHPFDKHLQGYM